MDKDNPVRNWYVRIIIFKNVFKCKLILVSKVIHEYLIDININQVIMGTDYVSLMESRAK